MGWFEIAIIIIIVLIAILIGLYFIGRRLQKKQATQNEAIQSASQTMTFFVIDKKKLKLKDANLPKMVLEQTPKYMRRAKLPILKVKVGPKVMSLICDSKVFETILPNQEVKAQISGIYVTSAKRIRGPVYEPPKKGKKAKKDKKDKK